MNRYDRYPGDWLRDTIDLSPEEDGIYLRLVDWYYCNERPIPDDRAFAIARVTDPEAKRKTQWVLSRFFVSTPVGSEVVWKHARIEREIERARPRIEAARINGLRGGRPKKKPSRNPVGNPVGNPTGNPLGNPDGKLPSPPIIETSEATLLTSLPQSATFIALPLVDGSSHAVTEHDVKTWSARYPAVDIQQELRKMEGWLEANPKRRKTARGIAAFIQTWLCRQQDRGPHDQASASRASRKLSAADRVRENIRLREERQRQRAGDIEGDCYEIT